MKPQRVTMTAIGVAGLLLMFFFVPLPVTRIRQLGLVQVQPDHQVNLFVEVPGILQKVHVREGEFVQKDRLLAEFYNMEIEHNLEQAQAQLAMKENMEREVLASLPLAREPKERLGIMESLAKARGDRHAAESNVRELQKMKKKLVIYAPRAGVVMGLPRTDEVYKYWDREQGQPFCTIGDASKLRVLVPVVPADYNLMQEDKKDLGSARQIPVTVRVQGRAQHTWQGHVAHWPEAEAKTIPLALSSKGGGPLAVKPVADPNQLIPQAQVFLVGVDIDNPDSAICPGTMSQVKIHCQYRSAAWWTWRAICTTFDLGLM